jgi:hypothetical protein
MDKAVMAAESTEKTMASEYPEPEDSENEAPVMSEDVAPDYKYVVINRYKIS